MSDDPFPTWFKKLQVTFSGEIPTREGQREQVFVIPNAMFEKILRAYILAEVLKTKPAKKTLVTELDEDNIGDFDDPQKFCVECGQYEYEGQLNCRCSGYNQALDDYEQALIGRFGATIADTQDSASPIELKSKEK